MLQALDEGEIVSHPYFSNNESIRMSSGLIVTEEGYKMLSEEFCKFRVCLRGSACSIRRIKNRKPGVKTGLLEG